MAEAIVGPLLNKLQEVALAEAKALAGVSREIDRLRDKLMWLHAVVHETDLRRRQEGNQLVRVLACQMREISFEAEDAIDRFYLQADLSHRDWRRAFTRFLASFGTQIRVRYALSGKIKSMNARLEDIVDNSAKFSNNADPEANSGGGSSFTWRASRTIPPLRLNWDDGNTEVSYQSDPIVPEEVTSGLTTKKKKVGTKLTGRKKQEEELEKHLLAGENSSHFICVVGESGVGKRALVRSAYNKASVRKHFNECIWESFPPDTNNTTNTVQQISSKLNGSGQDRYLVVIDCPMSTSIWNEIQKEMPKRGSNGGRKIVLIATSCHHHQKHSIIQLRCLDKGYSETLFNKKVGLKGRRESDYRVKMMNKVRENIEELTGGLPLAVVLLAKLLRTMDLNKWEHACHYLTNNSEDDRLKTVVSLSVDDLPDDLKSCLLYTAGFPERCTINADHLVRLWVAEGFLTPQHGVEPEELGQCYLKELIFRGLLQLVEKKRGGHGDGVELVAVHDRIQPFFRFEAQRTGFMDIQYGGGSIRSAPDTARRLALWNSSPIFPEFIRSFKKLRTVVSSRCNFGRKDLDSSASEGQEEEECKSTILCAPLSDPLISKKKVQVDPPFLMLLRGSPFLRVIDLEGVDIGEALPANEIGEMVHLQYLGVRQCPSLKTVPSSIGKLSKLQTVDVRGTRVRELPRSLWKITALHHVLGDGLVFPTSSGDLKLIQTLVDVVIAGVGNTNQMKWLGIRPLRRLHVVDLNESQGQDLRSVLEQLTFLEILSLSGHHIPAEFTLVRHVVSLELNGKLQLRDHKLLPDALLNLQLIQHLVLRSTHIGQSFVNVLAQLPVLAELAMLDDAYVDEKLVFPGDGFRSLTVLRLSGLAKLTTIEEEGDNAVLEKLATFHMIGMPDLSRAPRLKSLIPTITTTAAPAPDTDAPAAPE